MSDISEETHEFRQGTLGCLYLTLIAVLQVGSNIDKKRLRALVKDKIRQNQQRSESLSHDTDKNNSISEDTCNQVTHIKQTDEENELKALVSLCKKIICVIFITKEKDVITSVFAQYYGINSLFQKCVYLIYDETKKAYLPLYLFDNNNPDQLITVFDRKHRTIPILLKNFFKQDLKCKEKHE